MDDTEELIEDEGVLGQLRKQAARVRLQSALIGLALTVACLVLP